MEGTFENSRQAPQKGVQGPTFSPFPGCSCSEWMAAGAVSHKAATHRPSWSLTGQQVRPLEPYRYVCILGPFVPLTTQVLKTVSWVPLPLVLVPTPQVTHLGKLGVGDFIIQLTRKVSWAGLSSQEEHSKQRSRTVKLSTDCFLKKFLRCKKQWAEPLKIREESQFFPFDVVTKDEIEELTKDKIFWKR